MCEHCPADGSGCGVCALVRELDVKTPAFEVWAAGRIVYAGDDPAAAINQYDREVLRRGRGYVQFYWNGERSAPADLAAETAHRR